MPPDRINAILTVNIIQLLCDNDGVYSRAKVAVPARDHPIMLKIHHDNGYGIVLFIRKYCVRLSVKVAKITHSINGFCEKEYKP